MFRLAEKGRRDEAANTKEIINTKSRRGEV